MNLHDFIALHQGQDVVWGENDCSMFAAKWVEAATGKRLELPKYTSRKAAYRLIKDCGGLDVLWQRAADSAGLLKRYGAPLKGDVGLVETGVCGLVGVVFTDFEMCAWRADCGVSFFKPKQDLIKVVYALNS